jgi:hypothetical protein
MATADRKTRIAGRDGVPTYGHAFLIVAVLWCPVVAAVAENQTPLDAAKVQAILKRQGDIYFGKTEHLMLAFFQTSPYTTPWFTAAEKP